MDTRADFQRLLEDMDKVIRAKRQELSELDERLESSRIQLSEREANELKNSSNIEDDDFTDNNKKKRINYEKFIQEQKKAYEQELEKFNEEFNELELMNQELLKENQLLRDNFLNIEQNYNDTKKKSRLLADNLEELQKVNYDLNLKIVNLELNFKEQQEFIVNSQREKEASISLLNNELNLLKKAIQLRDEEIERLQLDNQFTLKSLGLEEDSDFDDTSTDNNTSLLSNNRKEKIIKIASAFREKDEQIKLLQKQLIQATKDLERNATLLELLNKQQDDELNDGAKSELILVNQNELINKCKMLEEELEVKDGQLNLVEFKNHQYEIVMPNKINDLIQKLIDLFYKKTLSTSRAFSDNNNQATDNNLDFVPLETIKILFNNLNKLLSELNSTQELLYLLDKLKIENKKLNERIKNLVSQLNAKLNDDRYDDNNNNQINEMTSCYEDEQKEMSVGERQSAAADNNNEKDEYNEDRTTIDIESSRLKTLALNNKKRRADLLSDRKAKVAEISKSKSLWLVESRQSTSARLEMIVSNQSVSKSQTLSDLINGNGEKCTMIREHEQNSASSLVEEGKGLDNKTTNAIADSRASSLEHVDNEKNDNISGGGETTTPYTTATTASDSHQSVNNSETIITDETKKKRLIKDKKVVLSEIGSKRENQQANKSVVGTQHHLSEQNKAADGSRDSLLSASTEFESKPLSSSGAYAHADTDTNTACDYNNDNNLNNDDQNKTSSTHDLNNNHNNRFKFKQVEERLRQVKNENELLELAMKEILLSIKWSDAQCWTILIDCPSLERLCQLIEARYITGSRNDNDQSDTAAAPPVVGQMSLSSNSNEREDSLLFQLVVLKSELDLLRGQNEQLRSDIKIQRREQLKQYSMLENVRKNSLNKQLVEVECQTDKLKTTVELYDQSTIINDNEQLSTKKCSNCTRLNQLINHLLECIVRIQTRVQINDDNYISRLLNLHKIIDLLEKDLSSREKMLIASRRECHLLIEKKLMIESQLQALLIQQKSNLNYNYNIGHKPSCPSFILFNNNLTSRGSRQERLENDDNNIDLLDEDDSIMDDNSTLDDNNSND